MQFMGKALFFVACLADRAPVPGLLVPLIFRSQKADDDALKGNQHQAVVSITSLALPLV